MRYRGSWGGYRTWAWALVDVQPGLCAAVCVRRWALLDTRGDGAAIVNGRGRSLTVVVRPRLRSTRLVGCCVRSSTGAAGYAWWWDGHSTWAWALVDSGGGALLTFNQAGGLPSAFVDGRCRIRVVVGRPWVWALVDSGGGSSLTFIRAGGLGVVRCRLSSMVVLVGVSGGVC